MNRNTRRFILLSLVTALFATGCAKKESDATNAEGTGSAATEPKASEHHLNIGRPDLSTPKSAYREMKYATDSLYAYYAIYPKDPNFGKIARAITRKYDQEADGFKKQEIIASHKGEIENGIKKAKENKYYVMNVNAAQMDIKPYNFEKKTFFNPRLGISQDPVRSYEIPRFQFPPVYGDNYGVGADVEFSNVKQFADVKVEDQEVARKMEGLRASEGLRMAVYFYANEILPDREDYQQLRPEITKVEYLDTSGNIVFTQTR